MALTTLVKDELANYEATKVSARKAEISTILRFTGGLHIVSGRIVVESEVDHEATAHRMRRTIAEIYGHDSELTSVSGGGLRRAAATLCVWITAVRRWLARPVYWICVAARCVACRRLW